MGSYIADSNGNQEVQVTTTKEVNRLDVTMTNHSLDAVLRSRMTEEEQERYDAYNKYYGNRDYLFDLTAYPPEAVDLVMTYRQMLYLIHSLQK